MAERKSFLLRVDREVLDAVQRWANDDLRSLNGQVEYLLREAAAPYFAQLDMWLSEGVIRDPYGEFMVVFNPKVRRAAAARRPAATLALIVGWHSAARCGSRCDS